MKIYYIDIIFKFNFDKNSVASEIFNFLHVNEYKNGKFALDFPKYQEANNDELLRDFERFANFGNIIRVFAENALVLENIKSEKMFSVLMEKGVIDITTVALAQESDIVVAWTKDLTLNHVNKLKKNLKSKKFHKFQTEDSLKEKIKELKENFDKETYKKFYFNMYSNTNHNKFMLVINRMENKAVDITSVFNPNAYGLSEKNNITWLPRF